MKIISDLHIHSRFSRACSKAINIPNLEKYAKIKGINLLGTGDFTHPLWIKELKENLKTEDGILKTESGFPFLLSTELANIYSQDGKGRRVHIVMLAPDFETVDQINEELLKHGRLDYDGRPIFGFSCVELVDMMMSINKDIEIIPAHIWTPWFSIFGSKSGFDTLEECFKEKTKHIHALETGLSSDPAMNWRLSQLDKYSLVSFSDLHSFWPWRMGREATVFDTELNYKSILNALRTKEGLVETIEVDPSYGKYHFDGHRNCNVCLEPKESQKLHNNCPKCGRQLTIGVLNRVEELADREEGFKPEGAKPFKSLIPLSEIISSVLKINQLYSKKIWDVYNTLTNKFGSELNILTDVSFNDLREIVDEKIADAIIKIREGRVKIQPGYDGVYGEPLFGGKKAIIETTIPEKQKNLSDF
ncbi:MAG: DNA helicase UvrD [Candidatus Aenigmarchaeota archaeon]|nr:DNA helicase UvrD [Candidatus Aenigmarchaeota archaeon]